MSQMQKGDVCLVTGVSGYLGSWLARLLLEQGYRVRGTVRHMQDTKRLLLLRSVLPGIEIVPADLRAPEGWDKAVNGCQWVFHVASPQAVPDEKERTDGALAGTRYLMNAAMAVSSVRKIVLTSSEAAIAYGHVRSKHHFSEDDWSILEGPVGKNDYLCSKTVAERLAWELISDPDLNPRKIPLSVINPSFIAGPSLVPWGRFSLKMLGDIATGRIPALLDMVNYIVDVRDCAAMHIVLMNQPQTDNHRHFCFGASAPMVRMAEVISEHYSDRGFAPKVRVVPTWLLGIARVFSAQVGSLYSKLGHPNVYETQWPDVYRYQYQDFDQIIIDSMDSMMTHHWLAPGRP